MYLLFMSFYFWIEMSNGNDLVLAQLLQAHQGLSRAQGIIIMR